MVVQGRTLSTVELQSLLVAGVRNLEEEVTRKMPAVCRRVISAEDILQEVWLAAFRGRASFRNDRPDAFDRWVTVLTERKLVDAARAARTMKRGSGHPGSRAASFGELFNRVASGSRTPSREVASREASRAVQIALCGLPEDWRRAIWLRHIEGRSPAEVAELMSRTVPAVRALLFKGMRELRARLGWSGMYFTDA